MVFLLTPLQRAIFVIKVVFLNLCIWISQQPNPTSGSCLYMQQIHPHPFYIIVVKQESLSELLSTPLIFMTGKWESWDPQWDMLSHCLFYELIRWEHSLRVSLSEAAMLQRFRKKEKKSEQIPQTHTSPQIPYQQLSWVLSSWFPKLKLSLLKQLKWTGVEDRVKGT